MNNIPSIAGTYNDGEFEPIPGLIYGVDDEFKEYLGKTIPGTYSGGVFQPIPGIKYKAIKQKESFNEN